MNGLQQFKELSKAMEAVGAGPRMGAFGHVDSLTESAQHYHYTNPTREKLNALKQMLLAQKTQELPSPSATVAMDESLKPLATPRVQDAPVRTV